MIISEWIWAHSCSSQTAKNWQIKERMLPKSGLLKLWLVGWLLMWICVSYLHEKTWPKDSCISSLPKPWEQITKPRNLELHCTTCKQLDRLKTVSLCLFLPLTGSSNCLRVLHHSFLLMNGVKRKVPSISGHFKEHLGAYEMFASWILISLPLGHP